MKKRSLISLVSATAASVSSLLALAIAPASAASTLYQWTGAASTTAGQGSCTSNCWSVAGNWESSIDGGVTWTKPATAAPTNGVDIQFDNTGLTANATIMDDIASLSVGSINFKNSATSYGYTVNYANSAALTVTTGVGSNSTNGWPAINLNMPVTFAGTTTIGSSAGSNNIALNNAVTVSTGTLTANAYLSNASNWAIAAGATLALNNGGYVNNPLIGAGAIVINTPTGINANSTNTLTLSGTTASTFSGTFDVKSGGQLSISSAGQLGSATLTIENGGQLYIYDSPTPAASSDNMTISNAITLGGNGSGTFYMNKGAIMAGLWDGKTQVVDGTLGVTLSGAVTLSSDVALSSIYNSTVTYNFTGNLNKNGHNLTAIPADQPTYGTTIIQVNGIPIATSSAATPAAAAATPKPKAPNTGFALVSAKATPVLGTTLAVTGALVVAARRMRPASKRR